MKNNPVAFLLAIVSVSFLYLLFISVVYRLPEPPMGSSGANPKTRTTRMDDKIGKFGEMVIGMLPEDLPFTVFLPSERAFERILRLHPNESLVGDQANDTYAILTRVLGFSAVPRMIKSVNVPYGRELDYDSLSGFTLYMSRRDEDGLLVVNRVRSEDMDLQRKSNMIVHIMDGVIMDADFEQSVLPDYAENDEG